jgi:hypothetical protein
MHLEKNKRRLPGIANTKQDEQHSVSHNLFIIINCTASEHDDEAVADSLNEDSTLHGSKWSRTRRQHRGLDRPLVERDDLRAMLGLDWMTSSSSMVATSRTLPLVKAGVGETRLNNIFLLLVDGDKIEDPTSSRTRRTGTRRIEEVEIDFLELVQLPLACGKTS